MVIDSHMHLIRRGNFNKDTFEKLGMTVPTDTPLQTLIDWMKTSGVTRAVAMGQDMTRIWDTTFGEDYLRESVASHPDFFIGLASVEPLDKANRLNKDALRYLQGALEKDKLRGVLFTPPYGQYYSNDKTIYPFYQLLLEHNAIAQFHHSAQMGPAILAPTKYADMFRLNDVLVDFPDLKIVVEHLGYPWTEHLLILMANDKNLWTDLAMMYDRPMKVAWSLVLAKEYGVIDRVMYASDYVAASFDWFSENPPNEFSRWIDFVKHGINEICTRCGWPNLSPDDIDGILWKNVSRLYGLA